MSSTRIFTLSLIAWIIFFMVFSVCIYGKYQNIKANRSETTQQHIQRLAKEGHPWPDEALMNTYITIETLIKYCTLGVFPLFIAAVVTRKQKQV